VPTATSARVSADTTKDQAMTTTRLFAARIAIPPRPTSSVVDVDRAGHRVMHADLSFVCNADLAGGPGRLPSAAQRTQAARNIPGWRGVAACTAPEEAGAKAGSLSCRACPAPPKRKATKRKCTGRPVPAATVIVVATSAARA